MPCPPTFLKHNLYKQVLGLNFLKLSSDNLAHIWVKLPACSHTVIANVWKTWHTLFLRTINDDVTRKLAPETQDPPPFTFKNSLLSLT